MQVVGLTGNIGSGKSTVGRVFQSLGIPVFNSDDEAKKAYTLPSIQKEVHGIIGVEIDFSKETWKKQIADSIFSNHLERQNLETLIHGYVQHKFQEWKSDQNSAYIIREAALASSFSPNNTDWLIEVRADLETRKKRVIQRSGITEKEFHLRDSIQFRNEIFPQEKTLFINNNEDEMILKTILEIDKKLNPS